MQNAVNYAEHNFFFRRGVINFSVTRGSIKRYGQLRTERPVIKGQDVGRVVVV